MKNTFFKNGYNTIVHIYIFTLYSWGNWFINNVPLWWVRNMAHKANLMLLKVFVLNFDVYDKHIEVKLLRDAWSLSFCTNSFFFEV